MANISELYMYSLIIVIVIVILEKKLRQKSKMHEVLYEQRHFLRYSSKLEKIYISLELINIALPYDRLTF